MDTAYWLLIVPMLLAASGIALVVPTLTNATLSSVGCSRSGVASGMLNSARQIGGLLGVALFGSWVSNLAPDAFVQRHAPVHRHVRCAAPSGECRLLVWYE